MTRRNKENKTKIGRQDGNKGRWIEEKKRKKKKEKRKKEEKKESK